MNKKIVVGLLCWLALSATLQADGAGEVQILQTMDGLQRYSHKLSLALQHSNWQLAKFYAHELEESAEALETIGSYHGKPIGALAKAMLTPSVEALDASVGQSDAKASDAAMSRLIESCNSCHQATGHAEIVIQRSNKNPFFQSFKPAKGAR